MSWPRRGVLGGPGAWGSLRVNARHADHIDWVTSGAGVNWGRDSGRLLAPGFVGRPRLQQNDGLRIRRQRWCRQRRIWLSGWTLTGARHLRPADPKNGRAYVPGLRRSRRGRGSSRSKGLSGRMRMAEFVHSWTIRRAAQVNQQPRSLLPGKNSAMKLIYLRLRDISGRTGGYSVPERQNRTVMFSTLRGAHNARA